MQTNLAVHHSNHSVAPNCVGASILERALVVAIFAGAACVAQDLWNGDATIGLHPVGCPDCVSLLARMIVFWQTPMLIVAVAAAVGVWVVLHHRRVGSRAVRVADSPPQRRNPIDRQIAQCLI